LQRKKKRILRLELKNFRSQKKGKEAGLLADDGDGSGQDDLKNEAWPEGNQGNFKRKNFA